MNLVVDASVAIKWFVRENLYEEANQLLSGGDALFAPDLLVIELANIAWKKAVRGEITQEQAKLISQACLVNVPTLQASVALISRATEIAVELNHPVYDCLYLACAEVVVGRVITADARLRKTAGDTKFEEMVRVLGTGEAQA